MPPLNAHLRFSSILIARGKTQLHVNMFLLGSVAPDIFDPNIESNFSQHHFSQKDNNIDLKAFQAATCFDLLSLTTSTSTFVYGYYSHLWLDVYFSEHGDELSITKPPSISESDLRQAIRREAEFFNASFILNLKNDLLSIPEVFALPPGLEFVNIERCANKLQDLTAQAQAASQVMMNSLILDETKYGGFMEKAAEAFILTHFIHNRSLP